VGLEVCGKEKESRDCAGNALKEWFLAGLRDGEEEYRPEREAIFRDSDVYEGRETVNNGEREIERERVELYIGGFV